ncbi:MIP family channel protein [Spizellomyces punctatus DAOM BR117]|uniref:MIP family channel protein n=1 Tax=Spizellomyces punctatus (strain DAOM BR117) TaxID=645134 RepID=A0A0L0HBB6_SPIPD|nr:MIP family channel protein [Spizellomyces punctatus DAOM BR117]KNC98018.1 MIP family channel protein [Spizellomyces punctatus DAOM BR117]|eukprot:XP_016606058.1 MIP family channel protein [Spizellomyces punctatus DAOM BR117]
MKIQNLVSPRRDNTSLPTNGNTNGDGIPNEVQGQGRDPMTILKMPMRGTVHVPRSRIWRAVVAEFIGTAFFVFFVGGSVQTPAIIRNEAPATAADFVITGFVQGLAILCLVASIAGISGGHINPAVTACLMVVRSMPVITGIMYMIAQFIGAIVGAALFKACVASRGGDLGATVPTWWINPFQTILIEFFITSMLLFVVLSTAVHAGVTSSGIKPLAPIPIGFAVAIGVFLAGPLTGGSMNPARSFGPAVVSNTWRYNYAFWVSPFLASVVVGILYKIIFLSAPISQEQAHNSGLEFAPSHVTLDMGSATPEERALASRPTGISEAEFINRSASNEDICRVPLGVGTAVMRSTGQGVTEQSLHSSPLTGVERAV